MKGIKLDDYKCTLTKISEDTSNKTNMVSSDLEVVDFDAVKGKFVSTLGTRSANSLKSNDGFFVVNENLQYFIEFKNGELKENNKSIEGELRQKNYDSVSILSSMTGCCIDTIKNKTEYILVYNAKKYKPKKIITDTLARKAKETAKPILNLDFFEGFLFKKVHTITPKQFELLFLKNWKEVD